MDFNPTEYLDFSFSTLSVKSSWSGPMWRCNISYFPWCDWTQSSAPLCKVSSYTTSVHLNLFCLKLSIFEGKKPCSIFIRGLACSKTHFFVDVNRWRKIQYRVRINPTTYWHYNKTSNKGKISLISYGWNRFTLLYCKPFKLTLDTATTPFPP